jgi:murein L,D-transpeptidase YcbB/YkuD
MRKLAILLLALFAIAGTSAARTHRKPHKVTRRAGVPRGKRYRVSKSKHTRRISNDGPARLPQHPSPERYKEIQQALLDKGYYKGQVSGEWNAESSDALRRFQADQKLQPDGKIGSLSLIALGLGPKRTLSAQPEAPATPATSLKPAAPREPETVSVPE